MRLKPLVFTVLFLTGMVFIVVPAMAQTRPPPQNNRVVELTIELRDYVESAELELFKGFAITITNQVRSALINKIDIVIKLFEKGNYMGGCRKLEGDIAPKLGFCETKRVRALSWLSDDPELEDAVYSFSDDCQSLIGRILELADPRPTP